MATTPEGNDKVECTGPGAGMGIALTFSCCNHFVCNLSPGTRTEAVGLLVRFRPAELGSMISSFNVFVGDGGGR
jgi:hypothetical protein